MSSFSAEAEGRRAKAFSLSSLTSALDAIYPADSSADSSSYAACLDSGIAKLRADPYLTLGGMSSTCTDADIKKAYRALSLKFHPDKNSRPWATAIFKELNSAYELLGDPARRKEYDASVRREAAGKIRVDGRHRRRPRPKPAPPSSPPHVSHDGSDAEPFRNDGRNSAVVSVSFSGLGLTRVGRYAFLSCENLVSVTLPASIEVLAEGCFKGCSGLRNVEMSEGLREIGAYCFNGCSSLVSLSLPETVEIIGSYSFSYCKQLEMMNIPDKVTKVGTNAFMYATKLVPRGSINTSDTDTVKEYLREQSRRRRNEDENINPNQEDATDNI
mmetsp:Transcript_543/g.954  ORF Transcript_543/g.954 Transcript_543/m.954 type:complete len:329 (-) Transcript_543:56-1042(-)